mmetsp:Transcript_2661/g.3832  ORF Transcript_2661/g.3832 Transcript_2661/m.3832 type:complete len:352 (+) Transcript_2661:77-1132(+)
MASDKGGEKLKNKPSENAFTQQNMAAWQPTLAPLYVAVLFFIIFLVFTGIGTVLIITTEQVREITVEYQDLCTQTRNNITGAPYCRVSKEFTIDEKITKPVYMYYYLENFYQNHRRYSVSRSDKQLGGISIGPVEASSSCGAIYANLNTTDVDANDVDQKLVYNPCGLIAWSMFNDTISLIKDNEVICNGSRAIGSLNPSSNAKCTKIGIAWYSDKTVKYSAPPTDSEDHRYPGEYYNEAGHLLPNTTDEDFMVWMRTAALPNFRKLYRRIETDLEAGTYRFEIDSRYPVKGFGGKKKVILSSASFLGGKNMFLSIAYFSVAGVCAILSIVFAIAGIVQRIRNLHRKKNTV